LCKFNKRNYIITKDINFIEYAYEPNTGSLKEKSTQRNSKSKIDSLVEISVELIN